MMTKQIFLVCFWALLWCKYPHEKQCKTLSQINNTAMELSRFKVTDAHRLYSFFSEEIMNSFCNGPIQELLLRGLGVLPQPQEKNDLLIQQWIASQGHVFVQYVEYDNNCLYWSRYSQTLICTSANEILWFSHCSMVLRSKREKQDEHLLLE